MIIVGKTFYLYSLFFNLQDWQLCKENPIPSKDLFNKKLYNASVYLNLVGEICANQLLSPIFGLIMTTINTTMPAFNIHTPNFTIFLSTLTMFTLDSIILTFTPIKTTPTPTLFTSIPAPILYTSTLTITTLAFTMSVSFLTTPF